MAKPILLSVDDDADVLRAIERDLRSQYGAEYRVMGSGFSRRRARPLEAVEASQRQRGLAAGGPAHAAHGRRRISCRKPCASIPDAKRALLTAYADTNAAISAINQANIHYFFMKPWDPPTEHLYPQLDDLLDDWQASYHPAYSGNPRAGHALVAAVL